MEIIWAKRRSRGRPGEPIQHPGAGQGWAAPGWCLATWRPPFRCPSGTVFIVILRYWQFVPCNSENISCTSFLKYKNSRKQELTPWHLVNRLVPKNDKYCIKMHIKHVGS